MQKYILVLLCIFPLLSSAATRPLLQSDPNYSLIVENQKKGKEESTARSKSESAQQNIKNRNQMAEYRRSGGR